MVNKISLDFNGVNIKAKYSHNERNWKGVINVYDINVDNKINFRFLDNYNRKINRQDLITKGTLTYIVDEYERSIETPLQTCLKNDLSKDWIDSVKVFLKIQ